MTDTDAAPDRDTLTKADTQPKLFLFIPVELAAFFGTAFFAINTALHAVFWGFIVVPLWAGMAVICRRDLNGVRVALVKLRLIMLYRDSYRWQGALSISPWPTKSKDTPHAL